MTKQSKVFCFVMVLIAVTFVLLGSANAQQNILRLNKPTMVITLACDTREQLERILVAHENGGVGAGQQAYQAAVKTLNEAKQPTCMYQRYFIIPMEQVNSFDLDFSGTMVTMRVVKARLNQMAKIVYIVSSLEVETS